MNRGDLVGKYHERIEHISETMFGPYLRSAIYDLLERALAEQCAAIADRLQAKEAEYFVIMEKLTQGSTTRAWTCGKSDGLDLAAGIAREYGKEVTR